MSNRRAMMAKVHIAKKDLRLTDESYRDLLGQVTGKASSKNCSDGELSLVLERFGQLGWKPQRAKPKDSAPASRRSAKTPQASKIRALWSSLYWLGEVETRDESAIIVFVRRQTDVDDPNWINAQQGSDCIEALKDWCKRAGFHPSKDWERQVNGWRQNGGQAPASPGYCAKVLLVQVLWTKLIATGCMRHGIHAGLDTWLMGQGFPRNTHLMESDQVDKAMELLGGWYRREKAKQQDKETEHGSV